MLIKIAIADTDEGYLKRLIDVLEEYDSITISQYTDKNKLESALNTRHYDILLFSPELYEGQIQLDKSTLALMFFDSTNEVPDICREFKKINKFQRISHIYNQILDLYAEIRGDDINEIVREKSTVTAAFYSPIGGAGKTVLALAAASRLAMQGKRVLYINFENMPSSEFFLPKRADRGLSDLVSCIGTDINFTIKLQSMLQSKNDNLFYVNNFETPNDVDEITEQEISSLISELYKTSLFDYIILDINTYFGEKTKKTFEIIDKIIIVEKTDIVSAHKMSVFMAQTYIINEYGQKMFRVINMNEGYKSNQASDIPLVTQIGRFNNPEPSQMVEMLSESNEIALIVSAIA